MFSDFPGAQYIIRVLTYGDGGDALIGRDREFADCSGGCNGRVGVMQALQVGERVEIIDGVFKQLRGTITRHGQAPQDRARPAGHAGRHQPYLAVL